MHMHSFEGCFWLTLRAGGGLDTTDTSSPGAASVVHWCWGCFS